MVGAGQSLNQEEEQEACLPVSKSYPSTDTQVSNPNLVQRSDFPTQKASDFCKGDGQKLSENLATFFAPLVALRIPPLICGLFNRGKARAFEHLPESKRNLGRGRKRRGRIREGDGLGWSWSWS
jgi:hypothetical protein